VAPPGFSQTEGGGYISVFVICYVVPRTSHCSVRIPGRGPWWNIAGIRGGEALLFGGTAEMPPGFYPVFPTPWDGRIAWRTRVGDCRATGKGKKNRVGEASSFRNQLFPRPAVGPSREGKSFRGRGRLEAGFRALCGGRTPFQRVGRFFKLSTSGLFLGDSPRNGRETRGRGRRLLVPTAYLLAEPGTSAGGGGGDLFWEEVFRPIGVLNNEAADKKKNRPRKGRAVFPCPVWCAGRRKKKGAKKLGTTVGPLPRARGLQKTEGPFWRGRRGLLGRRLIYRKTGVQTGPSKRMSAPGCLGRKG